MPRYQFTMWEETKYNVSFEADSLEHAKQLVQEAQDTIEDIGELPNVEQTFRKGSEYWEVDGLQEVGE